MGGFGTIQFVAPSCDSGSWGASFTHVAWYQEAPRCWCQCVPFPVGLYQSWSGRAGFAVPAGVAMEELGRDHLTKEGFDLALNTLALITKCLC